MPSVSSKGDGCPLHPVCTECTEQDCKYVIKTNVFAVQERNKQILQEWKKGKSNEELAEAFHLDTNTIKHILRKMFKEAKYSRTKG